MIPQILSFWRAVGVEPQPFSLKQTFLTTCRGYCMLWYYASATGGMSHLWLGHSLADVGGASGYLYLGCRVSPGDSLWISYPTCSRKTKNQNVKNGRYSGHFWHFDFLFFSSCTRPGGGIGLATGGSKTYLYSISMTHLPWL